MTDRNERLGELFDAACDTLEVVRAMPLFNKEADITQVKVNAALGIIDRYLSLPEADRQYALKREKADRSSELGTKIGELINEWVDRESQ